MSIEWQHLKNHPYLCEVYRAKVPGGWFVLLHTTGTVSSNTVTFYPDPDHTWDGSSMP